MHRWHFMKSVTFSLLLVLLGNTIGIVCKDSWTPLTVGTFPAPTPQQLLSGAITGYMDTEKLKQLMRASFSSQFNYCLLVWMFCDRTLNRKVNHVQEMVLRIAYKDCKNDFGSLLGQFNSISIHVINLQLLMTEIF